METAQQRDKIPVGLILLLLVFLLVFRIGYWTPMHSDDYAYFLKDVSFRSTVDHYMVWSGRLIADFLSSLVLGTGNHFFISLVNALAFVSLIAIIAVFPLFGERKAVRLSPIILALVFFLYWASNPDLGQTSFWLVGSANYLWTNVFGFLFLLLFLREIKNDGNSALKIIGLTLLSVIAGCSNENTSITTFLLMSFLTAREFWLGNKNWKLGLYIVGFGIGMSVLLLAPGNFVRLSQFSEWNQLGFFEKVWDHFYRRVPDAMARYWPVVLVLLVLLKCQPKLNKDIKFYVVLFAAASLISNIVLLPSPHIPKRALNGGFIYMLIATSFVAYGFVLQKHAKKHVIKLVVAACGIYFSISYFFIYHAYRNTFEQAQVRVAIIQEAIQRGDSHIEIPKFYFTTLLRKKRDRFDTYCNERSIATYYGTTATIAEYDVQGNYGLNKPPVRK